jgi:uncharacterized protein with PQ loop repeat
MYEELSYTFSVLSLIFYSIVYVPQFYVIYKNKSSDGISIWMLLLWTQADALSLVGTIILNFNIQIILIGWYHFIVGVTMILYTLVYDHYINFLKITSVTTFISLNFILAIILNITVNQPQEILGATIGWVTMIIYIIGRFPQIYMNHDRKSTEGLSILMYVLTILGNSCYIVVLTLDQSYLLANLPWLLSSIITILLDIFVILQYYNYRNNQKDANNFQKIDI